MRMFDSLGTLLRRALGNSPLRSAPWLISLALSVLIAAQLANALASLFGVGTGSAELEPPRPSKTVRREPLDLHKVAAAHLFGVLDDPATQKPRATTAHLILAGTIATGNPNHGVAIINGDDAPSKVYWAGQEVSGAVLRSVYLDHVLLDRNGSLEILELPKLASGAPRVSRAEDLVARDTPSSDSPPAQDDLVQVAPISVGRIHGFRIVGGKDLQVLRASGLRPSDVVTAINGTPLHDQDSFQQSINEIQSHAAVLTVMRNGHPTDINLND